MQSTRARPALSPCTWTCWWTRARTKTNTHIKVKDTKKNKMTNTNTMWGNTYTYTSTKVTCCRTGTGTGTHLSAMVSGRAVGWGQPWKKLPRHHNLSRDMNICRGASSSSSSSSSVLFTGDPTGAQGSSIAHVQHQVRSGEATCEEVMRAYLDQIRRVEPQVGSFMPHVDAYGEEEEEGAGDSEPGSGSGWESRCLEEARALDKELSRYRAEGREDAFHSRFPLAGVPLAVKDNICTQGLATTAGSRTLRGYVPPGDATIVRKLRERGCLVIGKTLCDEFGMGSTTESSASHTKTEQQTEQTEEEKTTRTTTTRNPWDTMLVPGGSSGGSAAAVSARECAIALGTDTGGSVRQPASFCGVVGLKPTYGRVSRFGVIAYASSLDCPGPIANTVEDCAIVMDVISGQDPLDASSASSPHPPGLGLEEEEEEEGKEKMKGKGKGYHEMAIKAAQSKLDAGDEKPLKGVRIGVVDQTMKDDGRLDSEVHRVMLEAIDHLKDLGADVETVDIPTFDLGLPAYYITAVSEASSNLSRYDGLRYGSQSKTKMNHDNAEEGEGQGGDETEGVSKIKPLSLMEAISTNRGELLGDEPLRRILMGTYTLSEGYGDALYKKAQVVRKKVQSQMLEKLESFDLLLTPTAPTAAYEANKALEDPLQMYLGDIMTVNVNLAGFPAISVPAGLTSTSQEMEKGKGKGLPVGIQFIGGPFEETKLLGVAHIFEKTMALPLVPEISIS